MDRHSVDGQGLQFDIVCVGLGPATDGFLTTLSRALANPATERSLPTSRVRPGMPLQVLCYERANDVGFGVSRGVTRGRGTRQSLPGLELRTIPMLQPAREEKLIYLLDPIGASRRPPDLRAFDRLLESVGRSANSPEYAIELAYLPDFLSKEHDSPLSIIEFNQWVGQPVRTDRSMKIWSGLRVSEPLIEQDRVAGVRLVDLGAETEGRSNSGSLRGVEVRAALTVVADGPMGSVGRKLDEHFGLPGGHQGVRDSSVGMKMIVALPKSSTLEAGTVLHTIGFPEPEIFGFLRVHPNRIASFGIFVPTWFECPVRTSYRYLQHWMQHPRIWPLLQGGVLRASRAKRFVESGRRAGPSLAGNGFARIGEGADAWTNGRCWAEAVMHLLDENRAFTRENLLETYTARRRASRIEDEASASECARDESRPSHSSDVVRTSGHGLTNSRLRFSASARPPRRVLSIEKYYEGKISDAVLTRIRSECGTSGASLLDALMNASGWPQIAYDGQLLVPQKETPLRGTKVRAISGQADHAWLQPKVCEACEHRFCMEMRSKRRERSA